eukprot:9497123-Pyramimonas_sp.AAC.1
MWAEAAEGIPPDSLGAVRHLRLEAGRGSAALAFLTLRAGRDDAPDLYPAPFARCRSVRARLARDIQRVQNYT